MFSFSTKKQDSEPKLETQNPSIAANAPLAFALAMSNPTSLLNFKNLASNFYTSFCAITFSPFRIGDYIKTQGVEGMVVHMDFRYLALKKEKSLVYVPISSVYKNIIEVFKK